MKLKIAYYGRIRKDGSYNMVAFDTEKKEFSNWDGGYTSGVVLIEARLSSDVNALRKKLIAEGYSDMSPDGFETLRRDVKAPLTARRTISLIKKAMGADTVDALGLATRGLKDVKSGSKALGCTGYLYGVREQRYLWIDTCPDQSGQYRYCLVENFDDQPACPLTETGTKGFIEAIAETLMGKRKEA